MTTRPKPKSRVGLGNNRSAISRNSQVLDARKFILSMGKSRDRESTLNSSPRSQPKVARGPRDTNDSHFDDGESSTQKRSSRIPVRPTVSQESLSDLQATISPHAKELVTAKGEMANALAKASTAVDAIMGVYQGQTNLISQVKDSWSQDQTYAERAQYLETLVKGLERRCGEEADRHEAELMALKAKLDAERKDKADVQNVCEQNYRNREKDIEKREAKLVKSKAVLEAEMQSKEQKYKKDHAEFVHGLQKEISVLQKSAEELGIRLKASEERVKKSDRAYDSLSKEVESLQQQKKSMQQELDIACRDDDFFIEYIDRIRTSLSQMCRDYFTELPTSVIRDANHASRKLEETSVLFKSTPLTESDVSIALRRANIYHLVMHSICENVWQPLFTSYLWNKREIHSFLKEVSFSLAGKDSRKERSWRHTTLTAILQNQREDYLDQFLGHMVDDIAKRVSILCTNPADFRADLRGVLADAIDFWAQAQMDGSRISLATTPSATWEEGLPFIVPEEEISKTFPRASMSRGFEPLLLFPEVTRRICAPTTAVTSRRSTEMGKEENVKTLSRGLCLFQDTNVFDMGVDEQEELAEVTRQALFRVSTTRKRRSTSMASEVVFPQMEAIETQAPVTGVKDIGNVGIAA